MKSRTILLLCIYIFPLFAVAQPLSNRQDMEKADSLYKLTRKLIGKGKHDSVQHVIDEGLMLAERLGIDSFLCKFNLEKAALANLRGDKNAGLQILLTKVAPRLSRVRSYNILDKYYNLAGTCYRTLLKYDSALYYFREDEKLNNTYLPYGNWLAYFQMALTFMQANLPEQAEQYFWRSYAITKPMGRRADHGLLLNEFASFLSRRNMTDKFALILSEYHTFMQTTRKDPGYDPIHSILWVDFGETTLEGKVRFMSNVRQSLLNNGDTLNAAYANNYIARYFEGSGQFEEALKYIRENLGRFNPAHYPEYQYVNTAAAYRILKKMGRHEEAVKEADKLLKLKDSLAAGQQREKIMEMEAKYQSASKEREIAMLNSQNALHEANLRNQQYYNLLLTGENSQKDARIQKEMELKAALNRENDLIAGQARLRESELAQQKRASGFLLIGASLLLLCAIAILYLYRKQRSKNVVIQKQADELEVLMKEIHHRVKNNMQIVSSLLDLQSNTIKDTQAAEAVKEGKNRVQSMAIIHQQLYQEGNIRGIRMDDYIHMLTQNIFSSYNINPDRISLSTDIQKLNLDVDTVIPLGLIINELVSNSLKYAFVNREKGIVSISLKEKDDCLELLVKDNGNGFPKGMDVHKTRSFGLQLITAFAQKLKAHLDLYNDNGAAVLMKIKKFRLAA